MNEPRKVCTAENPMPKGAPGRWAHAESIEVGEQKDGWPAGDIIRRKCLNCAHEWEEELPQ